MSDELQRFKEKVLAEYPRLSRDDTFKFVCKPGINCFNECCGDVNIFLTPYDILRMKNKLGIPSEEFLDKYTITPIDKHQNYPVILLKMNDDEKKTCQLVSPDGCTVYDDRPWACRYYPIGMASPREGDDEVESAFFFLLKENHCKGHEEGTEMTVEEWRISQGLEKYDEFGEMFKELTLHDYFAQGKQLDVPRMEMFHMACYNLDKFRSFILNSTFLNRFEMEEVLIEKLKTDDEELLQFGIRWLKFALFAEKTMTIRPSALGGLNS